MRYLLDTNAVSEPSKPIPNPRFQRRFSGAVGLWAITAPTATELRFGVLQVPAGRRRDLLAEWVDHVLAVAPVLPLDREAALLVADLQLQPSPSRAALALSPPITRTSRARRT